MKGLSLQTRLALSFGAVVLLVVLGVGGALATAQSQRLMREQELKVALYGQLAAKQLEPAIAFDDSETAREIFESMRQDQDVVAMGVYDDNGRMLQALGDAPAHFSPVVAERLWRAGRALTAAAPVHSREGTNGTVWVTVSLDRVATRTRDAWLTALAAALAGVSVALVLAWTIALRVSRRVGVVASAASNVAGGNLDQPALDPQGSDEIAVLIVSFNGMVMRLRELVEQMRVSAADEKKRLEEEVKRRTKDLESNVERYRALIENTNAIPFEHDLVTGNTYFPPGALMRIGVQPDEATSIFQLCHPDDLSKMANHMVEGVRRVEQGGNPNCHLDHRIRTERGTVDAHTLFTFPPKGDTKVRGISLDVTEMRKLELDLRQAQKLESVGRLASGVAHEINTPVQFVSDSVHFLRDAVGDLMSLQNKYHAVLAMLPNANADEIRAAEQSADIEYLSENMPPAFERAIDGLSRVSNIVRSMKEFAHPDQKEMSSVDLNRAIETTCEIARNEYKYVAELTIERGEIPLVSCMAGDINQVILNLVVNAAHAISDVVKGADARGKITLKTGVEGRFVVISVSDTGCGIAAANRERVFEPFYTTKPVGQGTGQGLSIARKIIVDQHHGELDFESQVGLGTTFYLRLPIEAPARQEAA